MAKKNHNGQLTDKGALVAVIVSLGTVATIIQFGVF